VVRLLGPAHETPVCSAVEREQNGVVSPSQERCRVPTSQMVVQSSEKEVSSSRNRERNVRTGIQAGPPAEKIPPRKRTQCEQQRQAGSRQVKFIPGSDPGREVLYAPRGEARVPRSRAQRTAAAAQSARALRGKAKPGAYPARSTCTHLLFGNAAESAEMQCSKRTRCRERGIQPVRQWQRKWQERGI